MGLVESTESIRLGCVCLAYVACFTSADPFADYEARKREAEAPLRTEYTRIATAHAEDPGVRQYQARLALIDEVTGRVLQGITALRDSVVAGVAEELLDGVADPGVLSLSQSPAAGPHRRRVSGAGLLAEYGPTFASAVPLARLGRKEQEAMARLLNSRLQTAEATVLGQGSALAQALAVAPAAMESLVSLCLVLPFLRTPDEQWGAGDAERIPVWMVRPKVGGLAERVALDAQRPLSAYHIARRMRPGAWTALPAYLEAAAADALKSRDYRRAQSCLRAGLCVAKPAADTGTLVELAAMLAQTLSRMGNPEAAADAIGTLLQECPQSPQYGRAAVLRLRYLYHASRFTDVLQEAPDLQADTRCRSYLPQILYVRWASCRHLDDRTGAGSLAAEFLDKFPKHAFAGDFRLAHALQTLSAGNYEESLHSLKTIQSDFPNHELSERIGVLVGQLEKATEPASQDAGRTNGG